ncbi:VOC family protein [Microbacterium aoyamense]|uniref:VOC family protein n=1 Tax=Microbacterium aoyamense TaxID=344166 RepID=A0ABP5B0G7_9MICO|nr:VOC family protein [Microbacterium aoyamense]
MPTSNHIDLVELRADGADAVRAARDFYTAAFGWEFTSYGPEYVDTSGSGTVLAVNGTTGDATLQAAPLAVLYVADLEAARDAVVASGGSIRHDIYGFPGGRRFHFVDPAGNELAAWSEDPDAA